MERKHRWFVYAALPGVVKMPDITPHAFISMHDTFEEADDAATEHRLAPDGDVLVYAVHAYKIVSTHSEAQLLEMAA